MERDTADRHPPVRTELAETMQDTARRLLDHPFYRGLADGTLPGAALSHFLQQDHWHVLPAYAAAHARCAAGAAEHGRMLLFSRMSTGTLEDAERRRERVRRWAKELALPLADGEPDLLPTTLGYTSFLRAAPARSLAAGAGAVLPAAWLFLLVTDELLTRRVPGSRYAAVIEELHPGDAYRGVLDVFLATVEEIARECTGAGRRELADHARHAARFEWAHVDAAWRREARPF
ncbi:TenA family protein [Streptomyces hygroscopicus]|uniref:TenA family protein n=1 Tax=Streptomyces hygroscopicus TaxID=1912 RepID=UPI00223EB720|nr:TenA family transcriptional regulator [Streptomyces hygroscopicus]